MKKEDEEKEKRRKARELLNLIDRPQPVVWYGFLQAADPADDMEAHASSPHLRVEFAVTHKYIHQHQSHESETFQSFTRDHLELSLKF